MDNVDPSPLGERGSPPRWSLFRHRDLDHAGSVQHPALFLVVAGRPLVELPDLDFMTAFREACGEVDEHGEHTGPRLLAPRNDLRDAHTGYATAATARIIAWSVAAVTGAAGRRPRGHRTAGEANRPASPRGPRARPRTPSVSRCRRPSSGDPRRYGCRPRAGIGDAGPRSRTAATNATTTRARSTRGAGIRNASATSGASGSLLPAGRPVRGGPTTCNRGPPSLGP